MKIYEIEAGATYWVVARNLRQAIDALWSLWETEGSLEETEEGGSLHIDEMSEKEARDRFVAADSDHPRRSLWDDRETHSEPCVVSCSDWP